MIDDTLENLGTTTNCHKLRTRIVWIVIGYCIMYISIIYLIALWFVNYYHLNIAAAVYINIMLNYCCFMNIICDIIERAFLGKYTFYTHKTYRNEFICTFMHICA